MDTQRISLPYSALLIIVALLAGNTLQLQAQTTDDVLRYSMELPSSDPVTIVMPGIANHTGFGAYKDNPAAMALAEEGYLSFSLSSRYVDESGSYLGNSTNFSDSQTGIGDIGFLHKVPTTRGSLVIGGGYSQTTDFNRAFSVNGRNNQSTITDEYSFRGVGYQGDINTAAFNAFAIEDINADSSASIFRFGLPFSDYPGINQTVELTERGQLGEYSAFIATEAFRNVFLGASIGYTYGNYEYRRDFLESDRQGDYDGAIIDSDDDGTFDTDIDNIQSIYTIDTKMQAFSAQLGIVYQPTEAFNIGASYQFPSKLLVDEQYNTEITTVMDNGVTFSDNAPGEFSYEIVRPQRLKAGVRYASAQGLTVSVSAEGILYSDAKYEEDGISGFETALNSQIRNNFNDVVNIRTGLSYKINEQFTPRVGYGYFSSPTENFDRSRQLLSGGFSARVSPQITFDFGLQYSLLDDQNSLYEYQQPNGEVFEEQVQEDVNKLHVMAGFKIAM